MYNDKEKQQLMNDLVEMETFKADVGDEGKILQNDLKEYLSIISMPSNCSAEGQ